MKESKEILSRENSSQDIIVKMMKDKKDGEKFSLEYLKANFLSSIGRSLYYARRRAGLTQSQVAERMNTTQSVIARFEADKSGAMSFHRYVDFAIACNLMPRSLVLHPILESIDSVRDETVARAEARHLQELLSLGHGNVVQAGPLDNFNTQAIIGTAWQYSVAPSTNLDVEAVVETAQNIVTQPQHYYAYPTTTSLGRQSSTVSKPHHERLVEYRYA